MRRNTMVSSLQPFSPILPPFSALEKSKKISLRKKISRSFRKKTKPQESKVEGKVEKDGGAEGGDGEEGDQSRKNQVEEVETAT